MLFNSVARGRLCHTLPGYGTSQTCCHPAPWKSSVILDAHGIQLALVPVRSMQRVEASTDLPPTITLTDISHTFAAASILSGRMPRRVA